MKQNRTFLKTALLIFLLTVLSSCNGQHKQAAIAKGTVVTQNGNSIRVIFQDSKGNRWFGSDSEGVFRYDGKKSALFTEKDGLPHRQIRRIYEDKKGLLYFETGDGICSFDGNAFTRLTADSRHNIGPASPNTWQYAPEDLWFTGPKGSVYRYDGFALHQLEFPQNSLAKTYYALYPNASVSPYSVYTIYKDRRGTIWFGTEYLGVCHFDGVSFTWISDEGLRGSAVRSIYQDEQGIFWFGNSAEGLFRYDGKTLTDYTAEKGISNTKDKKGNTRTSIMDVLERDGDLWIGAYGSGIWRYDGKKAFQYTAKEGLTTNAVMTLYKDPAGTLWVGTDGSGVFRFNGTRFEKIDF